MDSQVIIKNQIKLDPKTAFLTVQSSNKPYWLLACLPVSQHTTYRKCSKLSKQYLLIKKDYPSINSQTLLLTSLLACLLVKALEAPRMIFFSHLCVPILPAILSYFSAASAIDELLRDKNGLLLIYQTSACPQI